jgi:hypothetical protein
MDEHYVFATSEHENDMRACVLATPEHGYADHPHPSSFMKHSWLETGRLSRLMVAKSIAGKTYLLERPGGNELFILITL